MSYYVIVRGPLGAGKTAVSEKLARILAAEYISIDRVLEEHGLEEWEDGYISLASFVRANGFAVERARRLLDTGTPVVIDGNFYWRAQIRDLEDRLNLRHYCFTLKVPLEVCVERDRQREAPQGETGAREVYAKSIEFEYGIEIDARPPVDDVVNEILSHVPAGRVPPRR